MAEIRPVVRGVVMKEGKVLLLTRKRTDPIDPGSFDLPGGAFKYGETVDDAVRREVKEETGLEVNVTRPLSAWAIMKGQEQLFGVTFLCLYKAGEVKLGNEHDHYSWLPPAQIVNGRYPDYIRRDISRLER
jgi:8-oxo-dGTP diphosphatase